MVPGDIVVLRAGGMLMNLRVVNEKHALCSWLDESGARQVDIFQLDRIEVAYAASDLPIRPSFQRSPRDSLWGGI
jgi:hypothetical protein